MSKKINQNFFIKKSKSHFLKIDSSIRPKVKTGKNQEIMPIALVGTVNKIKWTQLSVKVNISI